MPGKGRKKDGRNRKGTGTIYFDEKRNLYVGRIDLGRDADAKRLRPTFYGKTEGEVQDKMDEAKHDALDGKPIKPKKLAVTEHFEDWLRTKKPPNVASATYGKYSRLFQHHIKPALGGVQLANLDHRRINAFYEHLDDKGLGRSSVADISNVLKMGLEDAVRKDLIPKNPAKLAAKRSYGRKEARFMTQEEVTAFLRAADAEWLADAFVLALHTGLRPGEWLGLPWDSVNLDERKLTVRQALHEEDGKLFIGDVKTSAARRTISLPTEAISALRRQADRQLDTLLNAGDKWRNEDNLVFTDRNGGFLRRTNIARRDMKRVLRRAALVRLAWRRELDPNKVLRLYREAKEGPVDVGYELQIDERTYTVERQDLMEGVTLHTFRHTHASMLIFKGVDIKTVSRRLGHENITITLQTYGHLLPGQDERAADAMDAFFAAIGHS